MGGAKDGIKPDDVNYGRVEVMVGGVWGSVCSSFFDYNDAKVFCMSTVIFRTRIWFVTMYANVLPCDCG